MNNPASLLALLLISVPAVAGAIDTLAAQRALFIELRPLAEAGDWDGVAPALERLEGYPLLPDLRAAWLGRHPGPATDDEIERLLERHAGLGFAPELRERWARSLARRHAWSRFLPVYEAHYAAGQDPVMHCLALRGRLAAGPLDDPSRERALGLWLSAYSQPRECDPVFDWLYDSGLVTPALRRARIELALEAGQLGLARYLARPLPDRDRRRVERWDGMRSDPALRLGRPGAFDDDDEDRRLVSFGFRRLARLDPEKAAALWPAYADYPLEPGQRLAVARTIAINMATGYHPGARRLLDDYPAADPALVEWRVRLALREQDFRGALDALAKLPPEQVSEPGWRYWRARALLALDREAEARPLLEALAGLRDYYGFLAADLLGLPYNMNHEPVTPDEARIEALAARADLRRTRELFLTGLESRGRLEWARLLGALSPEEQVQAAILAHRWGWHSRAIATAASAGRLDALELRFPMPWRETFAREGRRAGVDPLWACGIARSESLFMPDIASGAGAVGLMQLMPATGRETARRHGIRYTGYASLMDPETNIALGTLHLGRMLERFGGNPVLATAAYNAGPHRVARWLPGDGLLPADIWIDTVPYPETRAYVRRVLEAEAVYAWVSDAEPRRLSARMPPVTPP